MIDEPPASKGLSIWILILIAINGRGFINRGSTLGFEALGGAILDFEHPGGLEKTIIPFFS